MGQNLGMPSWKWKADKHGWRPMHLDPSQHSVVVTLAEHHEIHEGHMWHYTFTDTDVDILTPAKLTMHSPTAYALGEDYKSATHGGETYVHLSTEIYASGQVTVSFIEGGTVSGGVDVSSDVHNRNRDRGDTGLQTTFTSGTTQSGGTILASAIVGNSGNPIQREAGEARSGAEWVLAHDEDYTLVVTPEQDDTIVVINIELYEHIHKDDWDETLIQGAI